MKGMTTKTKINKGDIDTVCVVNDATSSDYVIFMVSHKKKDCVPDTYTIPGTTTVIVRRFATLSRARDYIQKNNFLASKKLAYATIYRENAVMTKEQAVQKVLNVTPYKY